MRTIRQQSRLHQRLAPVETALGRIETFQERWGIGVTRRDTARSAIDELVLEHGAREELVKRRDELEQGLSGLREKLKAAGALRQLLADAAAVVKGSTDHCCPVCQRDLPDGLDLPAALENRVEELWSDAVSQIEASIADTEGKLEHLGRVEEQLKACEEDLEAARQDLDALHKEIVEALGGSGIAENKVPARLDEERARLAGERDELAAGVGTLEQDLESLDRGDRAIREGLLPVLRKRREQTEHEDLWMQTRRSHEKAERSARRMEQTAANLDSIRAAVLAAKNELATEYLGQAGPRAQVLYKELIRHPLFDTLEISTRPTKQKVDYNFLVSAGGSSKTAREARLVLSDGQLTAAAIGLFFALAESTTHGLDLLYVDDPTQNLDLRCKEAMAKVVVQIARERQVIVSTQDEDFVNNLESEGFTERAVDHHLQKWDGKPTVKSTFPGDHPA